MISLQQLREYVVRPALLRVELWGESAENLVLGTGLVESNYQYVDQTTQGPGPAYGFWQMEEPTYIDIWRNYLLHQPGTLSDALRGMVGPKDRQTSVPTGTLSMTIPHIATMHGNLFYAAAMCRVHYRRVPKSLPSAHDAVALAAYWKQFYNTPLGAGTIEKAIPFFKQVVNQ